MIGPEDISWIQPVRSTIWWRVFLYRGSECTCYIRDKNYFTAYIKEVFGSVDGGNGKAKDADLDGSNLIGS